LGLRVAVSNEELRRRLLPEAMIAYFKKKLPKLAEGELLARIEETLKFLTLSPHCKQNIPVSQEIDEIWHLWILESQEYFELCSRIEPGNYIHHSSNDYGETQGRGNSDADQLRSDVEMLALYVRTFGAFRDDRIRYWSLPSHLTKKGWKTSEINSWLLSSGDEAA
jgi:hypothetical protein